MLVYQCDICGEIIPKRATQIDRKKNPYIAIINLDFAHNEKQYHACKECVNKIFRGTETMTEIEEFMKVKDNWKDH